MITHSILIFICFTKGNISGIEYAEFKRKMGFPNGRIWNAS